MNEEQPSLFSVKELSTVRYGQLVKPMPMSLEALQTWKQRVYRFQQRVQNADISEQGCLLDTTPAVSDIAETIAPFSLPRQNTNFWRWRVEDGGTAAYYFVIDDELPILLYVGETVKANQRWKGEHDCKRYIENYITAHRQWNAPIAVSIAFLNWAPSNTRARQTLESALIDRWRSPFNKQNWTFWGTPFVGGKES